jgi:hypothetical protein
MSFKNACFISYRHRDDLGYLNFVQDLTELLKGEVQLNVDGMEVYRDNDRREAGAFFNEALAIELCQSVCMVVVYIPPYFDQTDTYCATECYAMLKLEEIRLSLLGGVAARTDGLVFPIILRGAKSCPDFFMKHRNVLDLQSFSLSGRRLKSVAKVADSVRKLGETMAERAKRFRPLGQQACAACSQYSFPDKEDVAQWMNKIKPPPPPAPLR